MNTFILISKTLLVTTTGTVRVLVKPLIWILITLSMLGAITEQAKAASIGIVKGNFYTNNLFTDLTNAGQTVTEITSYNAATLSNFDAVIHYGNSFTDMNALNTYVQNGGTLIETPWLGLNYTLSPSLQVFSNGGNPQYSISYPGVNVLAANDTLLSGVNFPVPPGGFNIGRTLGNTFEPGVNVVANWLDGTAFIGRKQLGLGNVIGINMHVITSDTAYQVIDQPWATRLFVNAANFNQQPTPVPTPALLPGLIGMGVAALRKKRKDEITEEAVETAEVNI